MLSVFVAVQVALVAGMRTVTDRGRATLQARAGTESGQATAEYALVLLGAAAIALLLVAWAAKSGKIGALFDAVLGQLIDKAS